MPSSCSVSSLLTFFLHFLRHRWRAWKRKRWKKRQCVTLAAFFTLTFHFSFPCLFFFFCLYGKWVAEKWYELPSWAWQAPVVLLLATFPLLAKAGTMRRCVNANFRARARIGDCLCVWERGRKKAVRVGLFDWAIIFSTKLSDTKKKKVTKDVKRTFLLKPAPGRQPDSSLALYSCAQSKTHMMAALQQTFFFFFAGALLKKKKTVFNADDYANEVHSIMCYTSGLRVLFFFVLFSMCSLSLDVIRFCQ